MSNSTANARTYGQWRRPRRVGMGGFSTAATVLLFVGLLGTIILYMAGGLLAAVPFAVLVIVAILLISIKDRDGISVAQKIIERLLWWRTKHHGAHLYRSGPLGRTGWGTSSLPGVLAASKLYEYEDSYERPFALLYYPQSDYYSVVIAAQPDGEALVDQEQVDIWVARWGHWLAELGQDMAIVGASVVVETAPDTGTRLRQEICSQSDSEAPMLAQRMLSEVSSTYPSGSASISAWITLTWSSRSRPGARRRDAEEVGREIATRLVGITSSLSATGAGNCVPVDAQTLCRIVRTAYDPAMQSEFDQAILDGTTPELTWTNVGPMATESSWDAYKHDSGTSITWAMTQAPRGLVFSNVLAPLLAPHRDVARKRVTLLYRPIEAGRAAAMVEADVRAAQVRETSTHNPSARVIAERVAAQATAKEEARGAGLENFALMVTATRIDGDKTPLAEIAATVESLASASRLVLRPVYGGQDFAFLSTLPLGLVPIRHTQISSMLQEAL